MDVPMFCTEKVRYLERKMTFFQPECLPSRREKPIFELFWVQQRLNHTRFGLKKCGLTGATPTCIVVGWRLGAFGFPLLYKC